MGNNNNFLSNIGKVPLANRMVSKLRVLYYRSILSAITPAAKVRCNRCTCTRLKLCENCNSLGISEHSEMLAYFAGDGSLTTMTVHQVRHLFEERSKAFGKLSLIGNPLSVYLDGELMAIVNTGKQLGFSVGVVKRALLHFPLFCHISGTSLRGVTGGKGVINELSDHSPNIDGSQDALDPMQSTFRRGVCGE